MASQGTVEEVIPLTVGSSALPKIPLSHRWIISDVKTLTRRAKNLKGPTFCTHLPLKSYRKVFWTVSLLTKSLKSGERTLYLCLNHDCCATKDSLSDEQGREHSSSSTIVISDVHFKVLNPETEDVLLTVTAPSTECEIGGKRWVTAFVCKTNMNCLTVDFCSISNFSKYVFNDTLVIQVDATILCCTDPTEVLEENVHSVPLDDIRKELHGLFQEQFLADVTIKCGEEEFKVHKVILASQSPVFKQMFMSDMRENRSGVIEVSDIEPEVMSSLLTYIYTGSAPHLHRLAKELMNAANKYELSRLFAMCEQKLQKKLKASNVVETLLWANFLSARLKGACLRFIHLHPTEVKRTSGWKHLKENADEYSSILVEIMEFTM